MLGGVLGSIAFILYCIKFSPFKLHGCFLLIGAICFIGVDLTFSVPAISLVLTAIGGPFLQMGLITYGASVVPLYPVRSRATVLGLHEFTSRIAGVLAPIVVGLLLTDMTPTTVFAFASVPRPHRRGRRLRTPASGPSKAS